MSDTLGKLGRVITGTAERDAIHIAVAPVIAGERLSPGFHVCMIGDEAFAAGRDLVGIVDPFLLVDVEPGQRFWLYLYPGSITSLRHEWTHPAFPTTSPSEVNAAIKAYLDQKGAGA